MRFFIASLASFVLVLCGACSSNEKYRDLNRADGSLDDLDGSAARGARKDGSTAGGGSGNGGTSGSSNGGSNGVDSGFTTAFDGAVPEGATLDAAVLGLDGAIDLPRGTVILEDGAIVLPDGEVIDVDAAVERYTPEIDISTCDIGMEDVWSTSVDVFDEGGFALVPGAIGFGLAYRGLGVGGCTQTLQAMPLSAASGFGEPQLVDNDCKVITDVNLIGESDGWRMAWVDNFTNTAELHTILLDSAMGVPADAVRQTLTTNDTKRERKPLMATVAGQPLIAWISEDADTRARAIETQLLDGTSVTHVVLPEDAGQTPQAIALSQVGREKAALAWVGPLESPGVWLQPLDRTGAPSGDRVKLTDKVAVSSSVDMANRYDGGAVVYSIELDGIPQVRFRRLDKNGALLATERSIVGPPLRAQGAALAPLGGGYAVTYRALEGGDVTTPEVRLTFVTKEGNAMRDGAGHLLSFHIGDATLAQGRTAVSVSVEGEIMVAWLDGDASTGHNVLRVVRRRLDCQ